MSRCKEMGPIGMIGVSRGKIKDGGGELPLEVQALVRYVGDENFHVTDTMNVNEAGLATGSLQKWRMGIQNIHIDRHGSLGRLKGAESHPLYPSI